MKRLPFLLPAAVAMLAGLNSALLLLGLPAPITAQRLPDVHGTLMVLGFVGTVISLERAVAARHWAAFTAPALLGLGAILTVTPSPLWVGQLVSLAGTFALAAVYVPLWRRRREDSVLIQALGALMATGGALLWLAGVPLASLIPWLAAFVILTITGERLELARLAMGGESQERILVGVSTALVLTVVATLLWPRVGYPLLGVALLVLVAVLVIHDVARRLVRSTGLPQFSAACMLAGYVWLAVAGAIWLLALDAMSGGAYDAVIHAIFLGFTLSMIFAHAPVILPAVLGVRLPYRPIMILPAVLLHASLLVRVLGDAWDMEVIRQIGGVGNVAAVLTFAVIAVAVAISATTARSATSPPPATAPAPILHKENQL